jgi:hypothetical protein
MKMPRRWHGTGPVGARQPYANAPEAAKNSSGDTASDTASLQRSNAYLSSIFPRADKI